MPLTKIEVDFLITKI